MAKDTDNSILEGINQELESLEKKLPNESDIENCFTGIRSNINQLKKILAIKKAREEKQKEGMIHQT